jgi:hypothetical protein
MKREKPITLLGFSGQEEMSFKKYLTPLLNIEIENHVSQVSCEIGPLKNGTVLVIPGG